jgi:hypothetical protein
MGTEEEIKEGVHGKAPGNGRILTGVAAVVFGLCAGAVGTYHLLSKPASQQEATTQEDAKKQLELLVNAHVSNSKNNDFSLYAGAKPGYKGEDVHPVPNHIYLRDNNDGKVVCLSDLAKKQEELSGSRFYRPEFSPDSRYVAFAQAAFGKGDENLWAYDIKQEKIIKIAQDNSCRIKGWEGDKLRYICSRLEGNNLRIQEYIWDSQKNISEKVQPEQNDPGPKKEGTVLPKDSI